jgi:uncharacterized protein YbcV (DUF1398 family)
VNFYDIVLTTTIREVVSVGARDEGEAIDAALAIVKAGNTTYDQLDWDVDELYVGDPLDLSDY